MRERDLDWEALVETTGSNPYYERGALNKALAAIRDAAMHEGIEPATLHVEIRVRAENYRRKWPHLTLTATALAKHWYRVVGDEMTSPLSAQELTLRRLKEAADG